MHSENAGKLSKIYTMIYNENFNKQGLSDAAAKQTGVMGARWRNQLGQLKIAADSLMGVPDDQTAENKLPNVQESFAKEFRFSETGAYARVGLKAAIN